MRSCVNRPARPDSGVDFRDHRGPAVAANGSPEVARAVRLCLANSQFPGISWFFQVVTMGACVTWSSCFSTRAGDRRAQPNNLSGS